VPAANGVSYKVPDRLIAHGFYCRCINTLP
jgi:hypothetical protein